MHLTALLVVIKAIRRPKDVICNNTLIIKIMYLDKTKKEEIFTQYGKLRTPARLRAR
mgnify:CR=1 FL=1